MRSYTARFTYGTLICLFNFLSFENLYENVIGNMGGIIIGNSFHPYQIVNPKGTTIWHASYVQLYLNENKENAISLFRGNSSSRCKQRYDQQCAKFWLYAVLR